MSRHGDEGHVCAPAFAGFVASPFPEQFGRDREHQARRAVQVAREAPRVHDFTADVRPKVEPGALGKNIARKMKRKT